MNGGITYKDMETWKWKARVLDELREYLRGRADDEQTVFVSNMIERAYAEADNQ